MSDDEDPFSIQATSEGWGEPTGQVVALGNDPEARGLKEELLQVFKTDVLTVDAASVERLSCAAFQVLLAAMNDATAAGSRVVVRNPSFAFSLTFEAFGLVGETEPFTVEYC